MRELENVPWAISWAILLCSNLDTPHALILVWHCCVECVNKCRLYIDLDIVDQLAFVINDLLVSRTTGAPIEASVCCDGLG